MFRVYINFIRIFFLDNHHQCWENCVKTVNTCRVIFISRKKKNVLLYLFTLFKL